MDIVTQTVGGVTVATLSGDLDGKSAPIAHEELLPLCSAGGRLVLAMSGVDYMSSAGLRLLLLLFRQAQGAGGELVLAGLSDDLKDTMAATGFLSYFKTAETVEGAVAVA